jgi:glycosyltransferase involved in cell wall biosynthesis
LIRAWQARLPGRVIGILQESNGGIPRTRTAGLKRATGELVGVLDGDDRLGPGFAEGLVAALGRDPAAGCVYSNVELIDAAGRRLHDRDTEAQPSGAVFSHVAAGAMGLMRSLLARRDLVAEAGYLDEAFPKYDGFVLTLRLASRTRFAYVFEPHAQYRVHAGGDSRTFGPRAHLGYLEDVRREVERILARVPESDSVAIRRAWWWRLLVHGVEADVHEGGWSRPLPRLASAALGRPASTLALARVWRQAVRKTR